MNITEMLGSPVADPTAIDDPPPATCAAPPAPATPAEPVSRPFSKTAAALVLLAALGIGFGAGSYFASPDVAESVPPAATRSQAAPASVAAFAELFTSLYLTGLAPAEDLAAMYAGEPPAPTPTGTWVNRSAAVATEAVHDDVWLVTVAVDTMELVDGGYQGTGVQYYSISVAAGSDRPLALSAPARLPGPAPASAAVIPSFSTTVAPDQLDAVTAFFDAYLTGHGELARFVSATSQIPVFAEPPYESLSVARTGADSLGRIRVEVDALTALQGRHRLDYTVEMTFERGVWEVADLVSVMPAG